MRVVLALLLIAAQQAAAQTVEDSAGFVQADSFFNESRTKDRFPKSAIEAEPLRSLFWWGVAQYEQTEKDPVSGERRASKRFPSVSPVVMVTQSLNETWSVTGAWLYDFQQLDGWGLGAGVNMSQSGEWLRGIYYGGKGYFVSLGEYGNTFRAYGEVGTRILVLNHFNIGVGTSLGYGNNGVNTLEGATYGIIGELQARIGFWL